MPWIARQQLQGGKYVIEQVLGQGGFGITYKALHVELNQTVVIKTPNEYLSHDPEYEKYIERFIQEGRILARLSQDPHPHIVGVIDLFQEGATYCLVMDFVEGENLFEAVRRRGALPEAEIVQCIRQIGEALSVVHQAGLVHRDAHPGNIMVRSNGKAVLIDFGIAKEILPKTLSSKGIAGNDGFAPYEQMSRGSREPTVDVYCLAATLYYAVTGQRPTTSLARKLDDTSLKSPKLINPSVSAQLNQAILTGMALEANDRPQSMQAWLAMLEAPKATSPPPVKPVYRKEVVRSETKPNPEAVLGEPATKSPRIIPWGWLVGVLLSYTFLGYLLVALNALHIVWAVVGAWAWVRRAVAGAGAWVVVGAVAVAGAVAWAWAVAGAVAWAVGGTWAVAWTVAGALAEDKLQKSFSKFHTFLILASTSSLGLGLGWLGHRIFILVHNLLKL
ncbi:serine/threonine protein kinase [Nostocaceae cyanobacterium CENA369]|uniref:Serine/threonine protein kinase n=1 Tax=Dendronalium phyllosphericum CENA369 TaxID=1725256 RepID=A0A8J7HXF7_9NOST|nr:serine/threonine-protein kinase [Dendronalium phyllosphericum]MBH8571965.1 serine/threonine protein kinase [Dendronalium phyllosphericum CENA369]